MKNEHSFMIIRTQNIFFCIKIFVQLSEEREVKAPVILNPTIKPKPPMSNGSHSIVDVEEQVPFIRNPTDSYQSSSNRRVFQDIRDVKSVPFDHDDDKYKRRLTVVRNWWK